MNFYEKYPSNVSFYDEIPNCPIDLGEIEVLVSERLKLFFIIKDFSIERKLPEKCISYLEEQLKAENLQHFLCLISSNYEITEILKGRHVDFITHCVLRLAYCKVNPRFFVQLERIWFQIRFNKMSRQNQFEFINKYRKGLFRTTLQERKEFKCNFKAHFSSVPKLLILKENIVKNGFIYMKFEDLVEWLSHKFQNELTRRLEIASKVDLDQVDPRLNFLFSSINLTLPSDYNNTEPLTDWKEKIKYFPICMQNLDLNLKENGHLKHRERIQYQLFLKGIGVPLQDCLEYFHKYFMQSMTEKLYKSKRYEYGIKYNYGVVAGRINRKPYNCEKIQRFDVNLGQIHGCPFKHFDESNLRFLLKSNGITPDVIGEIMSLTESEKYTTACTKYLTCKHKIELQDEISHPNQYFVKCLTQIVDIEDIFQD